MTASEIAAVVGKDQKPWWPTLMWGDGEWWTRAEAKHVMPELAELAFIGAAEEACRLKYTHYATISYNGGVSIHAAWMGGDSQKLGDGPTKLSALIAALNESEAA